MEDLNFLLHREQVELLRAASAVCRSSRASHRGLARAYASRIADHRHPYRTPDAYGAGPFHPGRFGAAGPG